MPSINFTEDLNEEQRAAVEAPDGAVLVLAAAGTGKTRTLTYRVAYLVDQGIDPDRILLLTFTNRAAREMLERAQHLVGPRVSGLWGGTFHHLANRVLRRHATALDYGLDFTILDQDDARNLARACADELNLLGKHFPKPDVLLNLFSLAANMGIAVEGLARERFEHHPIAVEDILRVHKAYTAKKRAVNAMDFDDLLVNALRLFKEHSEVLHRYQERFLHVLVDEYQDTNTLQSSLVDILAAKHGNLFVVGDDFQSIYSWRGANFENILTFPKRYDHTFTTKLETNYRSVPEVLEVANACIAGNPEQFQKTLRAVRSSYRRPVLAQLRDGQEQARYVIEQIETLVQEGRNMNEIVVLYRAHYHAMELQLELARQSMPYVITSGGRFFEQAHIKDACAILRIIASPGDELAFLRLLQMFPRVGQRTAVKIWTALGRSFDYASVAQRKQLLEALPKDARAMWAEVDRIFAAYDNNKLEEDPGEVIHRFVNAFYDTYAVETFENHDRRMEDIQELILYTTRFESNKEFLSEMALMTNLDADLDREADAHGEVIRLSTVHQAKGLEWSAVFILWLTDGMFPPSRTLNEGARDAEERRLFYVAITRAKDELYLYVPSTRRMRDGSMAYYSPSRFLEEIPGDLLKRADVVRV